jgi:hypothetical protein
LVQAARLFERGQRTERGVVVVRNNRNARRPRQSSCAFRATAIPAWRCSAIRLAHGCCATC